MLKSDEGSQGLGVLTPASLEEILSDLVRQVEARGRLRDTLDASPTTMTYMRWLRKLPVPEATRRVAVLSSFTIETMSPFLEVEAYVAGWRPSFEFVQYSQWQNALLDAGFLGSDPLRACVLLLHSEELLPLGRGSGDAAAEMLSQILGTFRGHNAAPIFVGICDDLPAMGGLPFGDTAARGRAANLAKLRAALVALGDKMADVHVLDVSGWTGRVGEAWYDRSAYLMNLSLISRKAMPVFSREIARSLGCLFRPRRKLLALDLDNTLWGGIVGEDGVDGIAIDDQWPGSAFVAFQRQLKALRATGILLALNSKNNEADALEVFESREEMVLVLDDFSARRVNWQDKATNLVEIATELGLGLDSLVFADDSPMECALVRETLPDVEVVELGEDSSRFMGRILDTQAFDTLSLSVEDTKRAESYLAESRRRELQTVATDLDSFLSRSELNLVIRPAEEKTLKRIHQLTNKTNQFNIALERLLLEEVQGLAADGNSIFSASLTDRFGDYGLIGILYFRDGDGVFELRNLLMSCRALGRNVEESLLAFAREVAQSRGYDIMQTRYVKGPRNQQIRKFLERSGFTFADEDDSSVSCTIALAGGVFPWPRYIHVDYSKPGGS